MTLSLKTQVTLFVLVSILALGAINVAMTLSADRRIMEADLAAHGTTMAEALASAIDEGVANEDLDFIKKFSGIVHTKDVILAQVYSTLWLPLDSQPFEMLGDRPVTGARRHFENSFTTYVDQQDDWFDFYAPVYYHQFDRYQIPKADWKRYLIGYVRLKISTEAMHESARESIVRVASASIVVSALTILLLNTFIRRQVLRPIEALQQSVGLHKRGELPVKVDGAGEVKNEIGVLAAEFNLMSQSIREREALLAEKKEKLEQKNAELERFTYTISHDLKSPIITIKGFLGTLVADAKAGKFERMESDIDRIAKAADKMRALLEDVLELSRIGRMVNPSVRFSMTEVTHEAIEALVAMIKAKGVTVTVAPTMPEVIADRNRIREVMQNLIENAIKYLGSQPEPRIVAGCQALADGRQAYFVKDNGIGIDQKFHDKVFGLFEKLDPHSEGTGIGLALVKRIIELHGGSIWVESEGLGQGTTFYFTLPQSDARRGNA